MFPASKPVLSKLDKWKRFSKFSSFSQLQQKYNEPLSGHDMPRAGGIASMMRLPVQSSSDGKVQRAGARVCYTSLVMYMYIDIEG